MKRILTEQTEYLISLAPIVAIGVSIWFGFCFMESRTFNKLTGSDTTMWDAMFIQLRVQEQPISENPFENYVDDPLEELSRK